MTLVRITDLAACCGVMAGEKNMRKAGRTAWNEADFAAAERERNSELAEHAASIRGHEHDPRVHYFDEPDLELNAIFADDHAKIEVMLYRALAVSSPARADKRRLDVLSRLAPEWVERIRMRVSDLDT